MLELAMKNLKRLVLIPLAISSAILLMIGISHALGVFDTDQAPVGYVGMPAVTDNNVYPGPVTMFSVDYSSLDWTGNLHAYPVSTAGVISSTDNWAVSTTVGSVTTTAYGAAATIGEQNWDTGRKIVTLNGLTKVAFRWNSLSGAQQTSLLNENLLKYIRGDRANEGPNGNGFRARRVVLGDVIHSTPVYWEDPAYSSSGVAITSAANCPPSAGMTVNSRCKTVFFGANDGMLHAMDAETGRERFAFVPSQLISKLKALSDTGYIHQYFVDGQVAIKTYGTQSVLVGTLGGGSEGIYALDVTNPNPATETAAAANNVLWELSNDTAGFADLGYVYGKAALTKSQNGTPMAVVGNGYNSNSGTSGSNGFTGMAKLYLVNALTGAKIGEISTGSGGTSSPNGLSTPTLVDDNLDGIADYAYAGDVDGHLWKFDLKNSTATLLLTTDSNQAITMAPAVIKHPNGGYMVDFVTGKLFTADDQKDTATHYAYGVWDDALAATQSSKSVTVTQTLTEYTYTSGSISVRARVASANKPDWSTAKGWKTPLPIGGERLIGGDGALISQSQGVFRFMSSNPTINPTAVIPGENWWMELDPLTGGATGVNRFDLNADQLVNDGDALSITTGSGSAAVTKVVPVVGRHMGGGVRSQLIALFTQTNAVFQANYDRNGAPPSPATKGVAGGHFDVEFYKAPTSVCTGEGALVAGAKGQGSVLFNYGSNKKASALTIKVGSETVWSGSFKKNSTKTPIDLVTYLDGRGSTNYSLVAGTGANATTVYVVANSTGAVYNGAITVTLTSDGATPGYSVISDVTGGLDSSQTVSDADTTCDKTTHTHEYDDEFDKTGINMLNPSVSANKLSNAITASQQFKVLMMNQYLSPAAMLHIGNASYDPASAAGYIYAKDYQTGATLDVASLPTYTLSTVGSLVLNLPVDAFDIRDWWGNGDTRNGLLSSSPQCVYYGAVSSNGNLTASVLADMYSPVVPPAGAANGAGTPATVATAATGARHGGALTVQIIKSTTPQSAIEQNVAGRPEFGYRVRQADFYTYVLAEYTIFWHHPRRVCFGDSTRTWYNGSTGGNGFSTASSGKWNTASKMVGTGWTKDAPEDTSQAAASSTPATGSTDPKLGSFGSIAASMGGGGSGSGGGGSSGSSSDTLNNVVTGGGVGSSGSAGGSGAGSGAVQGMGTSAGGFTAGETGSNIKMKRLTWREIFR
jgi:hypothetical protein